LAAARRAHERYGWLAREQEFVASPSNRQAVLAAASLHFAIRDLTTCCLAVTPARSSDRLRRQRSLRARMRAATVRGMRRGAYGIVSSCGRLLPAAHCLPPAPAARCSLSLPVSDQHQHRANDRMYALCCPQNCDMTEEMRQECVDLVVTAIEKHVGNYDLAARMIKETMDKKYNENWIVIIGQGFSFEVTHEVKHVLWMYFCDTAVLCYKAGARQVGT